MICEVDKQIKHPNKVKISFDNIFQIIFHYLLILVIIGIRLIIMGSVKVVDIIKSEYKKNQ